VSQDILFQMSAVTDAIFQQEFAAIQGILKEESDLRQSLAKLDAHSQSTRRDLVQNGAMKSVGADILWQAWISKSQRQLNIELAHVMAKKFEAMTQIRKAFGRKEAVNSLLITDRKEKRKKLARLRAAQVSFFA
jgi:hypothetical protein